MSALRSVQRLHQMLADRARGITTPIALIDAELALLTDRIAQLRVPTTVLPFPVRGENDETQVGFPEMAMPEEEG